MNAMMAYSKVATIRDAQLAEKQEIKEMDRQEERRLDAIMEIERQAVIQEVAVRELARKAASFEAQRSPKRQRSSSAAAAQSQISFGAPAPVPALSAAAAAGAAAAGEAAAAAAAAPPSPLTIDRCDLDTRLFLQSAAGAEVQQDTFFGLPKELRTAIVRDWKREHAQRQRQGGRGGSSSSSAPKSTPKDNKSLKSFFKSK